MSRSRSRLGTVWILSLVGALSGACGQTPIPAAVADAGAKPSNAAGSGGAGVTASGGAGSAVVPAGGKGNAGTGGRTGDAGAAAAGKAGRDANAAGRKALAMPSQTQIAVRNQGAAPILLGTACGGLWLELFNQNMPIDYNRYCKCPCEDRNVCGCPAVCINTQTVLVPGESSELIWDGIALDSNTNPGCYLQSVPELGTGLTAKACWNAPEGTKTPDHCSEASFAYGKDLKVTIPASSPAPAPRSVTLKLVNGSMGPIEIVQQRCGTQAWFELDMGEHFALDQFCPCSCDAKYQRDSCPACGPCAEDVTKTLAVGASESMVWDGGFYYSYASGCAKRYALPDGTHVSGKLCYRRSSDMTTTCTPTAFELGQQSIVELQAY
jgi:hypothetical protein